MRPWPRLLTLLLVSFALARQPPPTSALRRRAALVGHDLSRRLDIQPACALLFLRTRHDPSAGELSFAWIDSDCTPCCRLRMQQPARPIRQGRTWRKMTLFRTSDPAPHKVAHALLLLAAEAVNLLRRLIVEVRLEFQKVRARCQQRCRRPGRGTGNARGHGLLRPRSAALPSSQSHSRRPGAAACCLRDGKADRGSVGRLSAEGLGWAPRPAQRTGSRARAKHTHPVLRVEPGALPILAAGQEQAHESVAPRRRRPVER
jgi:hypothetical protein